MDKNLNKQDIENNILFLRRVDLKGEESMAHAILVQKLQLMLEVKPETNGNPAPEQEPVEISRK